MASTPSSSEPRDSSHPPGQASHPPGRRLPDLPDLPVRKVLPELREALAQAGNAVLVAPPGAGKTTLAPLALMHEPWLEGRKILVLEPRRLATRAAATRMADLLGEADAGGTVGYRIRLDTKVSGRTRIEVVTEGVLTRMLQSAPSLPEVGLVVFDEFHERSLHADLGLALTLHARDLFRPDLRLLVMSATLEAEPVARLLGSEDHPAPVVESHGRMYPVQTRFRDRPVEGWIERPTAATVRKVLEEEEGDILVFLPGAGEIRRTAERLAAEPLPGGVRVHTLFGALPRQEQDQAITPSPQGTRKIVLATSIAETSLTIEGVRVVVDAGLMRIPRFDAGSGMTRLETVRVTRDSADQRRGRAGRVGPGLCYRLWTEDEDRGLVPARTPELLEADLTPLVLELAVWGAEPRELTWMDLPPHAAVAQARDLLQQLDALDADGGATPHGREMVEAGAHPRLAHLLVRGREMGHGALAADLAAILDSRDFLQAEGRAPDADLRLRVEILQAARQNHREAMDTIRGQRVKRGTLHQILRQADHWHKTDTAGRSAPFPASTDATGLLLALAYPDRIGQGRSYQRGRFLLRNGRGAYFREVQPLGDAQWLVAAEVDDRGAEARIFRAAAIDQSEIEEAFGHQVTTVEETAWDAEAGRVRAHKERRLGAMVLAQAHLRNPDPEAVAAALLEGLGIAGLPALPWTRDTEQLRQRITFLHYLDPELWPDASGASLVENLDTWLRPFVEGMRGLEDLGRVDLTRALMTWVGWDRKEALESQAPSHLQVPSGSRIRLDYSDPEAPALAVRLQEVFGMTRTPRLGGGRVPVTMRLLSPAQRPVQVTRDLASFWKDAYHEVRREMRGRYPKHYWPEDPLQAQATRRTKPR